MAKIALKPDFAKDSNEPVTIFRNNSLKLGLSNNVISKLLNLDNVQLLYFLFYANR